MIWIKCLECGAQHQMCHCDGFHCEERADCDHDNGPMLEFAHAHEACGRLMVYDSYGRTTTFTAPHKQCSMCNNERWIQIAGDAKLRESVEGKGDGPVRAVCPACNQHGEFRLEPADWSKVPVVYGKAVPMGEA